MDGEINTHALRRDGIPHCYLPDNTCCNFRLKVSLRMPSEEEKGKFSCYTYDAGSC